MRIINSTALVIAMTVAVLTHPVQALSAEKIGFVNVEYVLSKLPDGEKINKDLEVLRNQLGKQIQELVAEYEKQVEENKRNELTMSDSQKRDALKQMQSMQREIRTMEQKSQVAMQSKRAELMQPVLKKLESAIAEVAKENDYSYVLNNRVNGVSVVLYASLENDISKLVLKHLGVDVSK